MAEKGTVTRGLKITDKVIATARKLAMNGLNNMQIHNAIDIHSSRFYRSPELVKVVREARDELRETIAESLIAQVKDRDVTASIYLSKRLNAFDYGVDIPKVTNAREALAALSIVAEAEATGQIDESKSKRLEGIINSFLKGYELVALEERIEALESK